MFTLSLSHSNQCLTAIHAYSSYKIIFNIFFTSTLWSSNWSLSFHFWRLIFYIQLLICILFRQDLPFVFENTKGMNDLKIISDSRRHIHKYVDINREINSCNGSISFNNKRLLLTHLFLKIDWKTKMTNSSRT